MDEVQWGRTRIPYTYEFKERKTLAIHVHPDLSVSVSAPLGTDINKIREKVKKRGRWIRKSKREFELYLPKQPPRRYVSGETHRYLGRQFRLIIRIGTEERVKCFRGYFHVTCSEKPMAQDIKKLMDCWYTEKASTVFNKRYLECIKKVSHFGIMSAPLVIRDLKNRWGSCTKSGKIILNKNLIKVPTECIDYVIIHELCHLKEHNHGSRFWGLLGKVMPNFENRRLRLNLLSL